MVGTLADNWIAHGTGSLNIDDCRIGTEGATKRSHQAAYAESGWRTGHEIVPIAGGRFPSNVILTDPILDGGWDGVVGGGETSSGLVKAGSVIAPRDDALPTYGSFGEKVREQATYGDSGTYSRFFMVPKAPTRERVLSDGRRSPHPTQKPEALIRHLVTLVTPPDGLVLDPFLGSGTLGVVCDGLGVRWLGIEREPEYAQWAEDRIDDKRPEWTAA
jgi:hypothetical protein